MKIIEYSIALCFTVLLATACSDNHENTTPEETIDPTSQTGELPESTELPEFSERFDFIQGNDLSDFSLGQGFDTSSKKNLEAPLNIDEKRTFTKINWSGVSKSHSSANSYSKSELISRLFINQYSDKTDGFRGYEEVYFISNPELIDYIENLDFENSLSVLLQFQSRDEIEAVSKFTYTENAKKLFEEDELTFYDTYGKGFIEEVSYGVYTLFLLHVNVHKDHPLSLKDVESKLRQKVLHTYGMNTLQEEELAEIENILSSKGIKISKLLFSNVDNPSINEIKSYEEFYNILENDTEGKIFDAENVMHIKVSYHDHELEK